MWPPISSFSTSAACRSASSGVSANRTPPAFIRPPERTWLLITTGPPIRLACSLASSGVRAKPYSVTGIPSRRSSARDSNSKNRMACEPVPLRQLRFLAGKEFGELDHHLTLLPGRVVLHLPVDHVDAAAVGDRFDHLLGEGDLLRVGGEDPLGDRDLGRVERPRPHAAEQEGGPELGFAAQLVPDVAVGAVEGEGADGGAGVDHPGDRVVPRVLL